MSVGDAHASNLQKGTVKGEESCQTNDLDLDFPFFVVYMLNAEPKRKKRKKK
jgi:hypothetical protein